MCHELDEACGYGELIRLFCTFIGLSSKPVSQPSGRRALDESGDPESDYGEELLEILLQASLADR